MSDHVLVVEDDDVFRELLGMMLEDAGFTVDAAENGRIALAKIESACPDLMTLDLVMPEMTGNELLQRLEFLERKPLIVIVTGDPTPGPWPPFVVGLLTKPFRGRDLLMAFELALAPTPEGVAEKRKVPRRVLSTVTSILNVEGHPLVSGILRKLSPHGVEIALDIPLRPGDTISFVIPLGGDGPIKAQGEVLYKTVVADGFVYGIALAQDPGLDARIREYLQLPA